MNRHLLPRALRRTFSLMLLIILSFGVGGCFRSTGPTEVGVAVRKFSLFGTSGVEQQVYSPGSTFIFMPFLTDWYTFDTKLQNVDMVAARSRGDRPIQDELRFKTVDGNDIGLDVIITYRIIPEKAPYILQYIAQSDRELKDRVVRTICRSITRDVFGELKTEEFYVADERQKKADQAVEALNQVLVPWGVRVERLSTKDYRFNPEYQQAIEDKKVADQQAEKFKSEAMATAEEYLRKLEQAKGQVAEMTAKADGEYERAKIEADAYFSQQEKRALAIKAEGEAEAKGILEMNKALSGSGGEVMVKMKMAEALQGKQIILLPSGGSGFDLRSTNMNQFLEKYGVAKLAEGGVANSSGGAKNQ